VTYVVGDRTLRNEQRPVPPVRGFVETAREDRHPEANEYAKHHEQRPVPAHREKHRTCCLRNPRANLAETIVDVTEVWSAPTDERKSMGQCLDGKKQRDEDRHSAMTQPEKVVYTAKVHTTGGRENGASRSSDGSLDIRLSTPGSARIGTNPEQLFAAGWSAGFERAITQAARKRRISLSADLSIDAEVDLSLIDGGYFVRARLEVSLPGIDHEVAQALVEEAQQICPYSKSNRDNINVEIKLTSILKS
jgi:lipoyl-dependent peroxiredoxin